MRVLLLGGTAEARLLAERLHDTTGVEVSSSLAGRVRHPVLPPGRVRIGGFGGPEGLAAYLIRERIDAVVDATHPFAAQITVNAQTACDSVEVPLIVLRRPGWVAMPEDRWLRVASAEHAAAETAELPPGTVMLALGRLGLAPFVADPAHDYLIRTVDPPECPLPLRCTLLPARGPFTLDGELALFRRHTVTALVTKDSGGQHTSAKLTAARRLRLPVVMIDRPPLPEETVAVADVDSAHLAVLGLRRTHGLCRAM